MGIQSRGGSETNWFPFLPLHWESVLHGLGLLQAKMKVFPQYRKKQQIIFHSSFCCSMHPVSPKIMGVEPPAPSDQNSFLRDFLDNLSAFLKLVQLDLFLWMLWLLWLSRQWLAYVNGAFKFFFLCVKCFTTSFPMSYKLHKWHPGGPWSFLTGMNEASLSFWDQY